MLANYKISQLFIIFIGLLILFNTGVSQTAPPPANIPQALVKPKKAEFKLEDVSSTSQNVTVKLVNAITNKEIKGKIKVNGKIEETPFSLPFKAGFKADIVTHTEGFFENKTSITLTGKDSRKVLRIPCYPKVILLQGEVFNPDGSNPEGVEVSCNDFVPDNYYPGYHKLSTTVDDEGYYYLFLPDKFLGEKLTLHLISGFDEFSADVSVTSSDSKQVNGFEIPVFEAEILMPDDSMQKTELSDLIKKLNFKDDGAFLFKQALKIEKLKDINDYQLVITVYKSALKLANDDATKNYIASRIRPIYVDLIKLCEINNDISNGLKYSSDALLSFQNDKIFIKFAEKFEYLNIPGKVKSQFNDAISAYIDENYEEAFYLLKNLIIQSENKNGSDIPKILKTKIIDAYNKCKDTLINLNLNKTTDLYAEKEFLRSLLALDETAKYSDDLQILPLLGKQILEKLRILNTQSKFAFPLRDDWRKPAKDFNISETYNYSMPEKRWFMISQDAYADVTLSVDMQSLDSNHYLIEFYAQKQSSDVGNIEPGDVLFSLDSNDIVVPDPKDAKAEKAKSEPKNNPEKKEQTVLTSHNAQIGQFILAPGTYFVCVTVSDVEKLEFTPSNFTILLDCKQLLNEDSIAIKEISPGLDQKSAQKISSGFYTSLSIASTKVNWFKLAVKENKNLEINLSGLSDFSRITVQLFDSESKIIQPDDTDKPNGWYSFSLKPGEFFVKISNDSQLNCEYSFLVKIQNQSMKTNEGSSFQTAIALRPGSRFKGNVKRGVNKYYWFRLKEKQYSYINCRFTHSKGDIDMHLYKENDDKKKNLILSSATKSNTEYISEYFDAGTYYVRLSCNSISENSYVIYLQANRNVISEGKNISEAIFTNINTRGIETSINAQRIVWYQFNLDNFGELDIEVLLDPNEDVKCSLYAENENNLLAEIKAGTDDKSRMQIRKILGSGKYYLKIANEADTSVKVNLTIKFHIIDTNYSFKRALSINLSEYEGIPIKFGFDRYFKFKIDKSGRLLIHALFKFNKGDIDLDLYDAVQQSIKLVDSKFNDEILIQDVEPGEYFLKISNKTKGLENNISINMNFTEKDNDAVNTTPAYSKEITIDIPEEISQQNELSFQTNIFEQSWFYFVLKRNRRIQTRIDSELKSSKINFEIFHGITKISSKESENGHITWFRELDAGVYFIKFSLLSKADAKNKEGIPCSVNIANSPSSASMRGEFDNTTRATAIPITKSSILPIIYEGEQALWYKLTPSNVTDFAKIQLFAETEVYDFTVTMYKNTSKEPYKTEFSAKYPITIQEILTPNTVYFLKIEPAEPVQSTNVVIMFLIGPSKHEMHHKNMPMPLIQGTRQDVKLKNNRADYYVFCAPAKIRHKITCAFPNTNADIDLELKNSAGTLIADSEDTTSVEVIEGVLSGGVYYLSVKSQNRNIENVKYSITFEWIVEGDLLTPKKFEDVNTSTWTNTAKDKALPIEAEKALTGHAAMNKDSWYKFSLTKVMKVRALLTFDNKKGDLDLSLHDKKKEITISQTNSPAETLDIICNPGDYFIKVGSISNINANKFKLRLKLEDIGPGHTKETSIMLKLLAEEGKDPRKVKSSVTFKSQENLQNWYKVVFESPAWIELSGSAKGGRGYATILMTKQKVEDLAEKDEADNKGDEVAKLYVEDPDIRGRWGNQNQQYATKIGLAAGTYYLSVTGFYEVGTININCTYLTGCDKMETAPEISAGVFKNFNIPANSITWLKISATKPTKVIASLYSETNIDKVIFELYSPKIKIQDGYKGEKSTFIFSDLNNGEYYYKITSKHASAITVDFNIIDETISGFISDLTMLTNNAKVSGSLTGNSSAQYIIVIKEQTKIRINAALSDSRSVISVSLNKLTLPNSTLDRNEGSKELNFEVLLEAGVYIISVVNQSYYTTSTYSLGYEIPGSDLSD